MRTNSRASVERMLAALHRDELDIAELERRLELLAATQAPDQPEPASHEPAKEPHGHP